MDYARERLAARRAGPGGDPFAPLSGRLLAETSAHPENVPRVIDLALAGSEHAQEALLGLIAERNARGEPPGPLAAYAKSIAGRGPPRLPRHRGRLHKNYGTHVAILLVVIDLMTKFPGLRLQRNSASEFPSAFSAAAAALGAAGLNRGNEEAVRKVWKTYGPPRFPSRFSSVWPIISKG